MTPYKKQLIIDLYDLTMPAFNAILEHAVLSSVIDNIIKVNFENDCVR